jgi:hypothetical protein
MKSHFPTWGEGGGLPIHGEVARSAGGVRRMGAISP